MTPDTETQNHQALNGLITTVAEEIAENGYEAALLGLVASIHKTTPGRVQTLAAIAVMRLAATHRTAISLCLGCLSEDLDGTVDAMRTDRAEQPDASPNEVAAELADSILADVSPERIAAMLAGALYRMAYPGGEPGFLPMPHVGHEVRP